MRQHGIHGWGRHALAVIAGVALTISIAGGAAGPDVDPGDGATGAVQNGSNTALAGNGGNSTLDSEAAEIAVGHIETGDGSKNEISLISTIEMQTSSANGGHSNLATASDNDPVTDDQDVSVDDRDSKTTKIGDTTGIDNRGATCPITLKTGIGGDLSGTITGIAICDNSFVPPIP